MSVFEAIGCRPIINASGNWVYRQFATAIRAALLASFRLTNRASQSHEQAILKHQDVLEAIRMRRPDAARYAMEQLIGVARSEITDALRKARKPDTEPALTEGE